MWAVSSHETSLDFLFRPCFTGWRTFLDSTGYPPGQWGCGALDRRPSECPETPSCGVSQGSEPRFCERMAVRPRRIGDRHEPMRVQPWNLIFLVGFIAYVGIRGVFERRTGGIEKTVNRMDARERI